MANPGRTDHGRRFPVSVDLSPIDLYSPRSPGPPTLDTGRASAWRAGSFNSGKNVTILPVVEVRRSGTGKNDVLPD